MTIGLKLLRSLCSEQDVYGFIKAKLAGQFFYTDEEQKMFAFVSEHVTNHHALPKDETLLAVFPNMEAAIEPTSYYLDKVEERFMHKTMNKELGEVSELLEGKNVHQALARVQAMMGTLYEAGVRTQISEFSKDALGIITEEYVKAQQNIWGVEFGWPYLDNMTQGLMAGDVVSYVGRPAVGKTWKLLYTAHNAWMKQHKNVMMVSMEMATPALTQRIAAMHTHVSISELKKGDLPKSHMVDVFKDKVAPALLQAQDHDSKFWIMDGNLTSTPEQIFTIAGQFKPDVIFIDGAYLLRHENPRMDRYTRVAENIEAIKKLTSRLEIPTVCSYQFNRDASNKKKLEEVGLEDIGYSDAIGQISSIVLGLFQGDTVETMQKRTINVLKGREGAVGQFNVKWDFKNMDFSEIEKSEDVSQLQFV